MKIYFTLFFLVIMCFPAFCYIDPGTGSMLLYTIIGAAALLFAFLGFYILWRSRHSNKI